MPQLLADTRIRHA